MLLVNDEHHQTIRCFITCGSHEYDTVEQQGKKTWKYYRYSLTIEYKHKPLLAPPLIVISLIWRTIKFAHRRCTKKTSDGSSAFSFYCRLPA